MVSWDKLHTSQLAGGTAAQGCSVGSAFGLMRPWTLADIEQGPQGSLPKAYLCPGPLLHVQLTEDKKGVSSGSQTTPFTIGLK